ncbi:DUF2806 domain-containing protein [Pseudoalteromonas rubra]|uniref:Uncharacterized protein n=1 Tax=Pseudoalteromonas rubra TaxID=43658 RepID=A0A0F4QGK3_9GAMM|nr:DUF2806 domain-containing protein [Pseudoalteromonas rubra]KJZ06741.1 hypothetical protein TW77_18225 [Pseudoalteromonas rubra]
MSLTTDLVTSIKGVVPALLKPVSTVIVPFLPDKLLSQYLNGKMSLSSLKNNEELFLKINADLGKKLQEVQVKAVDESDPFSSIQLAESARLIENYIRYIETIRLSLSHIKSPVEESVPNIEDSIAGIEENENDEGYGGEPFENEESSPTWYDIFREIAMRKCEGWRRDLLARCVALEAEEPGSVTLKTLWNIGILETHSFLSLSLFFDSSVYLDDYPVIFLDRDDLMKTVRVSNGESEGVLIQVLTGLIDDGLLSFGEFELSTDEDVSVVSQSSHMMLNNDQNSTENNTYVRLEGYTCTDIGLELCKLYEPSFNEVSELNMQCLADLVQDAEGIGLYKK